jgi:hypothetical protein
MVKMTGSALTGSAGGARLARPGIAYQNKCPRECDDGTLKEAIQ